MPGKLVFTKEERKEKREMRRQAQRVQNVLRAEKMHAARLEFEAQTRSTSTVRKTSGGKTAAVKYHIGCSGWYYWHWGDHFYKNVAGKEWFAHYNAHFKTVELNAPFYSWPTIATVNTWVKQSKKQFVYTVKINELITHIKRFQGTKTLIKDFGLIADMLGPQMGCFLFQLPPSYHYSPGRLKDLVSQLDHQRQNVVEFRHKSWWNEDVYQAFRKTKTIFCSCSAPRLPDELVKTSDDVYIRFHGTKQWYRHEYTKEELAIWVKRIRECGAGKVWAYFNNDINGHAITNAKELLKQLRKSRKEPLL